MTDASLDSGIFFRIILVLGVMIMMQVLVRRDRDSGARDASSAKAGDLFYSNGLVLHLLLMASALSAAFFGVGGLVASPWLFLGSVLFAAYFLNLLRERLRYFELTEKGLVLHDRLFKTQKSIDFAQIKNLRFEQVNGTYFAQIALLPEVEVNESAIGEMKVHSSKNSDEKIRFAVYGREVYRLMIYLNEKFEAKWKAEIEGREQWAFEFLTGGFSAQEILLKILPNRFEYLKNEKRVALLFDEIVEMRAVSPGVELENRDGELFTFFPSFDSRNQYLFRRFVQTVAERSPHLNHIREILRKSA